jgi:tetratricopeptide (TPR) repeat protein
MSDKQGFRYHHSKPNRAKRVAKEALALARQGQYQEALPLIERAIRYDQINALNHYCALRGEICAGMRDQKAKLAIAFYGHAIECKRRGRYRDAKVAYLEAFAIDPVFLWPANNYAWLLATSTEPSVRDGNEALKYALLVCKRSRWNCWAFLGTLAAAYAESSNFPKAIGWQTAALELAPADHKMDAFIQLRHLGVTAFPQRCLDRVGKLG